MCDQNTRFTSTRINESVRRILEMKEKYEIEDKIITEYNIDKINEEVEEINNIARGNIE